MREHDVMRSAAGLLVLILHGDHGYYYDLAVKHDRVVHAYVAYSRRMCEVTRPGGTLLASAAGLLPLIPDGGDYWRLSAAGWRRVLAQQWPGCDVMVEAHGNCLAAVAAMYGLAQEELNRDELEAHDPRYPVLITMRGRKPATAS